MMHCTPLGFKRLPVGLMVAAIATCFSSQTVMAQGAYKAPIAYSAAESANPPNSANAANPAVPVSMPSGRPAAPMPSPLPSPVVDRVQNALEQAVPLTPTEVTRLMGELYERQRAGQQNVTGIPAAKPITSVEVLDLSPGAVPPVIRVALGQGAVLSFNDSAGRPWPILDNMNFNQRAYEGKLIGPHLYSVTLKSREPANLTIVLKDLARPIVITALPATDETDYLKEYTVPRFVDGLPPASVAASSREGTLSFNAPELINYLYRTPPKSARALTVAGLPGVMAWQISAEKMVVRTAGQVVIPAFSRRHSGTDGITVFELPLSPVVSITESGALHRISLGGYSVDSAALAAVK